jgi:hypothetical protein
MEYLFLIFVFPSLFRGAKCLTIKTGKSFWKNTEKTAPNSAQKGCRDSST